MKEKIAAVVLTLNRKKMVQECINSLLKQNLDYIIVVDNGSSDDTSKYLKSIFKDKINLVRNSLNLGSAGGFNTGIKKAFKLGADWVWLFDDDCEAALGSLKKILKIRDELKKKGEKIGFIASRLKWINGGALPIKVDFKNKNWGDYLDKSILRIKWSVYTGLFINMQAIKQLGLPQKELFLYEDDSEFTSRIAQGYCGFFFGKNEILHKDKISNRKGYLSFDSKLFSRYKFASRNGAYFAKVLFKRNKLEGFLHFLGVFRNIVLATLFSRKFMYFPLILLWFLRGFFFNPKIERL